MKHAQGGSGILANNIGQALRTWLGLLLIASAVMKVHWRTHYPLNVGWLQTPEVVFPTSFFELCLGSLLLVGVWFSLLRWVSIITFTLFVAVAATEAVGGAKTCGCFGGGVHIPPLAMAGFDLCVIVTLVFMKARTFQRLGSARLVAVALLVLGGVMSAAVWAIQRPHVITAQSASDDAADPFGAPGLLVVIDPEKLLGKPFLLASHIDVGSYLNQGRWIVLLVHHDCDVCAVAVPKYQAALSAAGAVKLAIIEIPPYAASNESPPWSKSTGPFGKLDTTRDWFATTPVAISLKDGIVQAATDGDKAATPDAGWLFRAP